jgi:2'-5' RNA ligase
MTLLTGDVNKRVSGGATEFGWVTIGEGDSAHHVFFPDGGGSESGSKKGGSKGSSSGKSGRSTPDPEAAKTKAFGSDPNKTYEFKHEIVDLKDLITSNTESGAVNPEYTKELQPRNRERTASKQQVEKIAKTFVPEAALWDFHQLDKGPAIIGPDNMVESGNGRTIAMKKMAADHPEKWAEYQDKLKQHLSQAGLSEKDLEGKSQPVLVRRRISDVDRAAFAQEANTAPVLQMSATEQALVDSKHISDAQIGRLDVGEDQTIDQALRSPKNRGFVSDFVGTLTPAERGPLMRGDGSLSQQGLWRVKAAVFTKTFPGEAGTRLADTFLESVDSNIKNFESGLSGALPKMAQADSLIKSGSRDKSLDISEDVSKSVDMLARLKEQGMPVQKFLNQGNMFGSELSGFQEKLLSHFDSMSRSAKSIRDFLNGYSDAVISAPDPHQGNLFGPSDGPTKEGIVNRLISSSGKEKASAAATNSMFTKQLVPIVIGPLTKKNIVPDADSLAAALYYDKAIKDKIEQGKRQTTMAKTKPDKSKLIDFANTGIMVGYFLDPATNTAEMLSQSPETLPDGSKVTAKEDLHITLAFLGDASTATVTEEGLKNILTRFCSQQQALSGTVAGVGRFTANENNGETNAFWAAVDVPGLSVLRENLVGCLNGNGTQVSTEHGFTPHITLAYIPENALTPNLLLDALPLNIDRLHLAWGGSRSEFKLTGNMDGIYPVGRYFTNFAATDKSPALEEIAPDLDGEQEYIIKSGKIFECGDYKDKDFSLNEEELKTAVSNFKPVALDIEHYPSVFDGKLGYLGGVSIGQDGKTLLGRVMLTRPTAELLKDMSIKVSTTWDSVKKTITKLALVLDPRVSDAVVMSRAAHFNQDTVRTDFEHLTEFVGARHNASDLANLQNIHDTAASMGAVCQTDNPDFSKEHKTMPNSEATKPEATVATDASVALSSEVARLQALIDKQSDQLVELSNRERRKDAVAFSASQVEAGKINSASQEFLTAIYEQSARDDANRENKPAALVVFSSGKGKEAKVVPMESRVETLKALFTALPSSQLDKELVASIEANPAGYTAQNLVALFNRGGANSDNAEDGEAVAKKHEAEKNRIKSMSDLGKKTLKSGQ